MTEPILPGNIYSGNKRLAMFTNPTELAFKKENLDRHYPVFIAQRNFADAESAYHFYVGSQKGDFERCKDVCRMVLENKLRQYPELVEIIKVSGGLSWIEKCSHFTYARTLRFRRWEGLGLESPFIKCLYEAYKIVSIEE